MNKLTDLKSEFAVLSGLFHCGEDAYLDVADFLQADTFTDTTNQALYNCFKYLYEEKNLSTIDAASVISAAEHLGYTSLFDKPEEQRHLRGLFAGSIINLENVRVWASQIRKLHVGRLMLGQLQQAGVSLSEISGREPIEEIIGIAENAVLDFTMLLQDVDSRDPHKISDGLGAFLDHIEEHPVEQVGISSGFPLYDKYIGGGFRRKAVSLIGARSGCGKTMVADNIAIHIARKLKIPVLHLDTEMADEDHWARILPNLVYDDGGRVTINEIETGKYSFSEDKKRRVRDAQEELEGLSHYYLNISGRSFEDTVAIMRRWIKKHVGFDEDGNRLPCIIIYDYLKLMDGTKLHGNLAEYQQLGFMITALHNFAVRHDVPIVSFIQLNRDGIDNESSGVIAGSDRILWLVTNFAIFKWKSDEEIADMGLHHGNRKMVVVKARHGEGMQNKDYINIFFEGKFGRVYEGETRSTLKRREKQRAVDDSDPVPFEPPKDDDNETPPGQVQGLPETE